MEKELIPYTTVSSMILAYDTARAEIAQAFALMEAAKDRLAAAFGKHHCTIFPRHISDCNLDHALKDSMLEVHKSAWRGVISKLQISELLSVKRNEMMHKQLDDGALPPLTEANLMGFLAQLAQDIDSLLVESAKEVFDWLRPHQDHYKTNSRYVIGRKVIRPYLFNDNWGRLNYHYRANVQAMDNVFSLLDGKGASKYPNNLITAIETAIREDRDECKTPYFYVKWFKNGNGHITFKRLDLLAKLNKIGAEGKLSDQGEKTFGRKDTTTNSA